MSEKLKKILIIVGAVFIALAIVLFVLYKIFVTPNVKVALTLIEAKGDIVTSFDYYLNDDEKNLIEFATKESGESEYALTFDKSPLFEGSSAVLSTEGNLTASVSKLKFNKFISLDLYADKSDILINLPLFDSGLKIPYGENLNVTDFNTPSDAAIPLAIVKFFKDNNIDAKTFFDYNKSELIDLFLQADIKKDGSETVKIGKDEKKADVYVIRFTKEDMTKLSDLIENYFELQNTSTDANIRKTLTSFAKNNTIYLKIRNLNLYEIKIVNANKQENIVTFSAEGNQFDTITCFVDGEKQVKRKKTTKNEAFSDTITVNNKKILSLSRDEDSTSFSFDNGNTKFAVDATGMNLSEDELSFENLKLEFGDGFAVSGEFSLRKRTSTDKLSFDKSAKYLDVSKLSPDEWTGMGSTVTGLLENIPSF